MTTNQRIEVSKEARLWIGQIITPLIVTGVALYSGNPKVREYVNKKINKFTDRGDKTCK